MKPPRPLPTLLSLVLAASAQGEILERVIAKVNGDIITLSEFENRQIAAVQAAKVEPDKVEAFLREHNQRILQDAIDDLLLVQRADEIGLRLRPDYIKDVIEGIKKENNLASDEALQEQLRREGMTLDDLKRQIERSILRRQVLAREVEPKAAVTEADARAEYDAHPQNYMRPASVHLEEILLKGEDAQARGAELVSRARAGEDFAGLARTYSVAPSRATGGDLGVLRKGELNPQLEAVAFSLAAGAVSDPIPAPDGVRVLRVVERTEGGKIPFDEAKADIEQRLRQERWNAAYDRYVEDLRKAADVDLRVREVPLQVDLPASPALVPPLAGGAPPLGPAEAGAPPGAGEAEFETTPQAKPEHVVPSPATEPSPSPSPSPTPSPPPS